MSFFACVERVVERITVRACAIAAADAHALVTIPENSEFDLTGSFGLSFHGIARFGSGAFANVFESGSIEVKPFAVVGVGHAITSANRLIDVVASVDERNTLSNRFFAASLHVTGAHFTRSISRTTFTGWFLALAVDADHAVARAVNGSHIKWVFTFACLGVAGSFGGAADNDISAAIGSGCRATDIFAQVRFAQVGRGGDTFTLSAACGDDRRRDTKSVAWIAWTTHFAAHFAFAGIIGRFTHARCLVDTLALRIASRDDGRFDTVRITWLADGAWVAALFV